MGKPEGKRSVRGTRHRWKYIKIDLTETRLQGVNWVNMAQDMDKYRTPVNTVMIPGFRKIR